jgi:hypothetical protein
MPEHKRGISKKMKKVFICLLALLLLLICVKFFIYHFYNPVIKSLNQTDISNETDLSKKSDFSSDIDIKSKEFLSPVVDMMNEQMELPKMLSPQVKMHKVLCEYGKIFYNYTNVMFQSKDVDKPAYMKIVKDKLKISEVCKENSDGYLMLFHGIHYVYTYYDKNGKMLFSFVFTKSDCAP